MFTHLMGPWLPVQVCADISVTVGHYTLWVVHPARALDVHAPDTGALMAPWHHPGMPTGWQDSRQCSWWLLAPLEQLVSHSMEEGCPRPG